MVTNWPSKVWSGKGNNLVTSSEVRISIVQSSRENDSDGGLENNFARSRDPQGPLLRVCGQPG
jgi:hypothetical protein